MIIQITPDDIKHGTRKSCRMCPVARALQRVSIKNVECQVTINYCYGLDNMNGQIVWEKWLPIVIQEFIQKFDDDRIVEPFDFELDIPEKYLAN